MVALSLCRRRCTCGSTRNGIVRSRRGGRAWPPAASRPLVGWLVRVQVTAILRR